jgi:penicillin-binding protein 1C
LQLPLGFQPQGGVSLPAVSLVHPGGGTVVQAPREPDGTPGRIVFEAACRNPSDTLYWRLDSEYLDAIRDIHPLAVLPEPGPHVLTVVDGQGNQAAVCFTSVGRQGP